MFRIVTPARIGLVSAASLLAAAVMAFGEEARAATPTPCADHAALQHRLDDFDARWNASDAWGLTAQFTLQGSLGAGSEAGRQAVYRELIDRLGHSREPRRTQLVRAIDVGQACLVDVSVRSGERSETGLFLLAHGGGIVAMR